MKRFFAPKTTRPSPSRLLRLRRKLSSFRKAARPQRSLEPRNPSRAKHTILGLLGLILLIALGYGISRLLTDERFQIHSVEVIGNDYIADEEIIAASGAIGKSIFLQRTYSAEQRLLKDFVFFKRVEIRKIWPDSLVVNIAERQPQLILINLNGVFIIDDEGLVIEVLKSESLNFSPEKIEIVRGLGDPEAKYVEQRIRADMQGTTLDDDGFQQEADAFDFEAIPLSEKIIVLEQIKEELTNEIISLLDENNKLTTETRHAGLPRVYVYENRAYEQDTAVDPQKLIISTEVTQFLKSQPDTVIEKITWEGDYLVSFQLLSGKRLIFGVTRDLSEQIEDYLVLRARLHLDGRDFSVIDLSSSNISVR